MVKTFKSNLSAVLVNSPAAAFITKPGQDPEPKREEGTGADNAQKVASLSLGETKCRRVQLLMRPTAVESLKRIAARRGVSFNELICRITDDFIKGEE